MQSRYAGRNNRRADSCNHGIACGFYKRIAVLPAVIHRIGRIYREADKIPAALKQFILQRKRINRSNGCNAGRNMNSGKVITIPERSFSDAFHTVRNPDLCQTVTVMKSEHPDGCDTVRNCNLGQIQTSFKCTGFQSSDIGGKRNRCNMPAKMRAVLEFPYIFLYIHIHILPKHSSQRACKPQANVRITVNTSDRSQFGTALKCSVSDRCNICMEIHSLKIRTSAECTIINFCNSGRNRYTCESRIIFKCIFPNA